ncbi:hypothetical protein PRECH8_20640 [Insulibacter thermoxylanivorax]|uniref:Uncharacterized protein n=1 Tax=Insulibacter thermoxylanivorax TaxID=2749268 RepID=A0A916VGB2_9BACL|nr:hypothetical protein [Insulibacter thermoxylanivorax]GFR38768.1 hypothetical protein PRECH8_20640 [Insulibacter thermoxylanivorax]
MNMSGYMIATVILTIVLTWILLVSYHYAYKRKWGNENAAVDQLPENHNAPKGSNNMNW